MGKIKGVMKVNEYPNPNPNPNPEPNPEPDPNPNLSRAVCFSYAAYAFNVINHLRKCV